nr:OmpA family protein [Vibrio sp. ES.051]
MDISQWKYKGTKLECNLLQMNSSYGKFYFRSEVRGEIRFISDIQYESNKWHTIILLSQNAPWHREASKQLLTSLNVTKPSHRFVFSKGAEALFESVSTGKWVTLSLGEGSASILSEIVIPTLQIEGALKSFNACRQRLPELTFAQARDLVLLFGFGQKELSHTQQETLAALHSYVSVDERITKILIDSHTDNVGASLANLSVSRQRAEKVAQALKELGVDKSMLEVRAHGSRYPITSNASARGQAKNRRVTLRLVRDNERTKTKNAMYVQQQTQQMKVKVQ